eukprot:CAMPEP_0196577812 /NCGR_PEP_ID=MMETSP1081-20130531/6823_1 /TAXON_ID=36882 /ORGANISM="Pyramimonas amylifera, Strain CCMP720" /LENGTH=198 /DNA_ID=CAMNT_0041896837 /DNA_START=136 /DNA_END=732 /DNA_ORIENTATION=+
MGGFFVEFGAMSPTFLSNTYAFETFRCWRGLLIEAQESYQRVLHEKRRNEVINGAVCDRSGPRTFTEVGWPGWSGFRDTFTSSHLAEIARQKFTMKDVQVQCYKLMDLLSERQVTYVDYLAIDVEGAEPGILPTINFKHTKIVFEVVQIEVDKDPENWIPSFMEKQGYRVLKNMGGDSIFVRQDGPYFHLIKDLEGER